MLRFLASLAIMSGEVAAVAGVVAAGYFAPFPFAVATMLLTLALGVTLERARLLNELPFYFAAAAGRRWVIVWAIAIGEAVFKALLAGVAALLTFSGTDRARLVVIAAALGVVLYLGTNLLRWLTQRFEARPARWGFFRLAVPLGLLFSLAIAGLGEVGLIATPRLTDIGTELIFRMPERPRIDQASELLFSLKLYFDGVVTALLGAVVGEGLARAIAVVISTNTLAGFVLAVYAVVIAEGVLRLERAWLGSREPNTDARPRSRA